MKVPILFPFPPFHPRIFCSPHFSLDSSTDLVEPTSPHISDILVSHYDCSKQHNFRQFSSTQIQPYAQAPSSVESTCAIANVFVRANARRPKAWTCQAYVIRENLVCVQSNYTYRRHDRTDYQQNTMEHTHTLDSMQFVTFTELIILNSKLLIILTLLTIFKNNSSLKLNNLLFV